MAATTNKETEIQKGLKLVKIRLVKEKTMFRSRMIRNSDDAVEAMRDELAGYDREVFCILNLKTDGSVINMNIVSQGTLNSSLISPREVFKSSILSNAAGIIMLHNHPSGNVQPSPEDYDATKRMVECGKMLDIAVVDHIVVGAETGLAYSFKAHDELGLSYCEAHSDIHRSFDDWER